MYTPLSAGGAGLLVCGTGLLVRGAKLLVRGMNVLFGGLFVVGLAPTAFDLPGCPRLAPADPMLAPGEDPIMPRGGDPIMALGGEPIPDRDVPRGLPYDHPFVLRAGLLVARRTDPCVKLVEVGSLGAALELVRPAKLAPGDPMMAPGGPPPGKLVDGLPTMAPPGAPPGSPATADPMRALEGAPAFPWAGSLGAGATAKTTAPSRISPSRAARALAVNEKPVPCMD